MSPWAAARPPSPPVVGVLAALCAALLLGGCAGASTVSGTTTAARAATSLSALPSATPLASASVPTSASAPLSSADVIPLAPDLPSSAPGAPAVVPTRVTIPRIGVASPLETLRVSAASRLLPPQDPARAGWFPLASVPGDLGAAVIAGHRDSLRGPAVFWRLTDLRIGDRIAVARSDGSTAAFRVAEVRRVSRAHFPTVDVYGPTPDRTLRLITCGGTYDHLHGRYLDNVLVLAFAV